MHILMWKINATNRFTDWYLGLPESEAEDVTTVVELLGRYGPRLPFPYSSAIASSRHPHMRELRIQHRGRPLRVLYAFDPGRAAVVLLGSDKTGDERWYDRNVPEADTLYDDYLDETGQA
ncbi:MAG: type II toxin-antitoxin system RelE/ParE family toxin [Gemmatimonadota bacterium]